MIASPHKLPRASSDDSVERSFAYFAKSMKSLYKMGKLPKTHYDVLISIPGWTFPENKPKVDLDLEMCKEMQFYVAENGRLPSRYSKKRHVRKQSEFIDYIKTKVNITDEERSIMESLGVIYEL
jgi:hypothetical protein